MMRRILILFVIAATLAQLGCKGNNTDESAEKDQEAATAVASDNATDKEDDGESANAPATDRYPKIPFGKLSSDERAAFVEVAKAELCPCEGSTESLDECLQDTAKQCSVALGAAATAMQQIESGRNKTDTLAKIAEYLEAARKVHTFDLENTPSKGAESDPKVVVVEFADFECPYCKRASNALDEVMKTYGSKGVRLYYKNFPLSAHSNAELAARAATAAHLQGKFWPMHDLIFKNQSSLGPDKIDSFARQIGLNFQKFKKDLESPKVKEMVATDRKEGEAAEITGTPAIFIDGRRYIGPPDSAQDLARAFDEALAAAQDEGSEEGQAAE